MNRNKKDQQLRRLPIYKPETLQDLNNYVNKGIQDWNLFIKKTPKGVVLFHKY